MAKPAQQTKDVFPIECCGVCRYSNMTKEQSEKLRIKKSVEAREAKNGDR